MFLLLRNGRPISNCYFRLCIITLIAIHWKIHSHLYASTSVSLCTPSNVVCCSQTLSAQGFIAFSISICAERIWWLQCQNLVRHSPVVWWVLNSIFKEMQCCYCQCAVLMVMSKVICGLAKHKNVCKFCCIVANVSHGARQIQQNHLTGCILYA